MITTVLAFIFVFGILVFVHELGHFLAAKFFGVRVEEFGFGFPPKIWSKKVGETEYSINLLPIGGFVKLTGEDGSNGKDKKSLASKRLWQKTVVFVAGVAMNAILAWVLLSGFYLFGGNPVIGGMDNHPGINERQQVVITKTEKGYPAESAGVLPNDKLVSVDGEKVYSANLAIGLIEYHLEKKPGLPVTIEFNRNGKAYTKDISFKKYKVEVAGKSQELDLIGVTLGTEGRLKAVWYMAPIVGALETVRLFGVAFGLIGALFIDIFTKFSVGEQVGGPVAIYKSTEVAAKLGFDVLIQFMATLSISLSIMNILPIPALDGGHIVLTVVERLRGKKFADKTKGAIILVGYGLLLLLVAVITVKDFSRFGITDWFKGLFK